MRFCDDAKEQRGPKKENPRPTLTNRGRGTLRVSASCSDIAVCARGSIFLKGKNPSNRRGHPPNAIDRYKDLADQGKIRVETGTEGYPPDLFTLVKGVNIGAGSDTRIRFLRRIPIDPMTGRADWNLSAIQDDPGSTSWGGNNVFDVHTRSQATALDGTKYSEW